MTTEEKLEEKLKGNYWFSCESGKFKKIIRL
jgi:hypothetical protein